MSDYIQMQQNMVVYPRPMAIFSHYDKDGRIFSRYTDNSVTVREVGLKDVYQVVKKWNDVSDETFSSVVEYLNKFHNLDLCIDMLDKMLERKK